EHHRLRAGPRLADVLPGEVRPQFGVAGIAVARPYRVERRVVRRAQRVVVPPLHGAEGAPVEASERAGMFLARGEEARIDATAAMVFQQHRFGAIEDASRVVTRRGERAEELF